MYFKRVHCMLMLKIMDDPLTTVLAMYNVIGAIKYTYMCMWL